MKKINLLYISSCLLIILFSIVILFVIIDVKNILAKNVHAGTTDDKAAFEGFYLESILFESINNDMTIDKEIGGMKILLNNSNHDPSRPLLVCHFSSIGCQNCIDYSIDRMREEMKDFLETGQVVFLAAHYAEDALKWKFAINIGKEKMGLPIETMSVPFYFILDQNTVKHVFIPDYTYPQYTNVYLKTIKEKYFERI